MEKSMDEQENQSNNTPQSDDYFTNKKKESLGASLKAKMEKSPAFAGKNKFITLAIVLVLVVGGVITAVVLSADRSDVPSVSDPAPEEDPVRAAIARRKAELAEAIEGVSTPEDAAPIIAELEELINQLTVGENARSEFFHSDQRDYMILKARAFINSRQINAAIAVYEQAILFEGTERSNLFELYSLLADAYRRMGRDIRNEFEQYRALMRAMENAEYAVPAPSETEVRSIEQFIVILEAMHGWHGIEID